MNTGTITDNNRPAMSGILIAHGVGVNIAGENSIFNMSGGTISGHMALAEATTFGGGVYVGDGGTVHMTGGRITDNAARGGGGVAVRSGGIFNMAASTAASATIDSNEVWAGGAGVWMGGTDSEFNLSGGTIGATEAPGVDGNTSDLIGGGILLTEGSTFEMTSNNAAVIGNGAEADGGGVTVHEGANFIMNAGTIARNTTDASGAGVNVSASTFTMNGGTIGGDFEEGEGNTAGINGGGVRVVGAGTFNLQDTDSKLIAENEAENGGGIWIGADATMTMPDISSGLSITNNTAQNMGGGIYTQRIGAAGYTTPLNMTQVPAPYSNLTLRNVYFNNNTADTSEIPPIDVLTDITNITFDSTSTFWHPINNYDINFRQPHSPPTGLTLGSTSTLPVIVAALVFVGLVCFYYKRHRDKEVQLILSAKIPGQARDDGGGTCSDGGGARSSGGGMCSDGDMIRYSANAKRILSAEIPGQRLDDGGGTRGGGSGMRSDGGVRRVQL